MQMGPEESRADNGNFCTNANYRNSQTRSVLGFITGKSPVGLARSSNSFLLQLVRETRGFLKGFSALVQTEGWFILLRSCLEVFQAVSLQKEGVSTSSLDGRVWDRPEEHHLLNLGLLSLPCPVSVQRNPHLHPQLLQSMAMGITSTLLLIIETI